MSEIIAWQCPVCLTLTLLERALANQCIQTPRREDCPLPLAGLKETAERETELLARQQKMKDSA